MAKVTTLAAVGWLVLFLGIWEHAYPVAMIAGALIVLMYVTEREK